MHKLRRILPCVLLIPALLLASCGGGQPIELVTPLPNPTVQPQAAETPTQAAVVVTVPDAGAVTEPEEVAPAVPAAAVAPGEIVFVREGQLWAVAADGTNERQLTAFAPDTLLRDLVLSPDGSMLAFTANSAALAIFGLADGQIVVRDEPQGALVARPVWSPESDTLYYQRITLDPVTSAPTLTEVWTVASRPGAPARLLVGPLLQSGEVSADIAPAFGFVGGRVLLEQLMPEDELVLPVLYSLDGSVLPLVISQLHSAGVWDVSPDRARVLLYERDAPGALYVAGLDIIEGAVGMAQLSPADGLAYFAARFAPDGQRIMVLRSAAPGTTVGTEAVLFTPAADGAYTLTSLGPEPDYTTVALSWHSEAGVIAQRLPLAGGDPTLWLLPLDGSPGRPLTTGEQPVAIPGG